MYRESEHGPGVCLCWGQGGGSRLSKARSLLVNFKHKTRNLKCKKREKKKEKPSSPHGQLSK